MKKQFRHFTILVTFFFINHSCNTNSKPDENYSIIQTENSCVGMEPLNFEQTGLTTDNLFRKFVSPIDSINGLLQDSQVDSLEFESNNDNTKTIDKCWSYSDRIIKMSTITQYKEYVKRTDYFVLDECNFMKKLETEYYPEILDLHSIQIYHYHEATLINAIVISNQTKFEHYTNISENTLVLLESERVYERYKKKLKFHCAF